MINKEIDDEEIYNEIGDEEISLREKIDDDRESVGKRSMTKRLTTSRDR